MCHLQRMHAANTYSSQQQPLLHAFTRHLQTSKSPLGFAQRGPSTMLCKVHAGVCCPLCLHCFSTTYARRLVNERHSKTVSATVQHLRDQSRGQRVYLAL